MYLLLIVISSLFFGCLPRQAPSSPSPNISAEQIISLKERRQEIRSWAITCSGGIACGDDGDGDSMLWAGLLCASGEVDQCNAAYISIDNGKINRAPGRLNQSKNSSSRDMFLGAMHYVVATKDAQSADAIYNYIKNNNYKLCLDAVDNRCEISPKANSPLWGTMGAVWKFVGLSRTSEMKAAENADDTLIKFQSVWAESGYPTHLVAVQLLLRKQVGAWTVQLQDAANVVANRQPNNPFYDFVANGPTSRSAALVLAQCPSTKPERAHQWAWQRDESEAAWNESMGWDCIFLINIMVGQ